MLNSIQQLLIIELLYNMAQNEKKRCSIRGSRKSGPTSSKY